METLKIGSLAPDFILPAVDGNTYSLSHFNDLKGFIIIFSCNHCPYVRAYENRIKKIQSGYSNKGVSLFAINSNDSDQYEDDSFENMKSRASEMQFNFPYLRDEDQSVAKAYGASHTPEIFLFDSHRKLVFHGKIDDNWRDESKVVSAYLRDAIEELIEGKEISVPETFTIGCTIKWKP
ncbi:MAG: thioredoxin family protein [Ignavibacteriaceae bacterium]|nr:thioredoxin family protein [Ignavibacteriaceae bacterium]